MKTLILNGSPRQDGDTAALIRELISHLHGECKIFDCYNSSIASCTDCSCCREQLYCPNEDAMQDIYGYLSECENLILASPIHYAELSAGAKMLIVTKKSYTGYAEKLHQMLTVHGISHIVKNRVTSSFVAIDGKTVWYASGEIFGNSADDCVLRVEDEVLAGELADSIR